LARRGITKNVVGYSIYGDYRQPNPPLQLIKAVAHGDIDVAIAWGPMAGYLAKQQPDVLAIVPLTASAQDAMPFEFSISMGVRRDDAALKARLDTVLRDKHKQIQALLDRYNVPQVAAHPGQLASGGY
jgi:mxaJ protein